MALQRVFEQAGVPVAEAEALADMGLAKRDHIRAILAMPRVAQAWKDTHRDAPAEADVTACTTRSSR